MTESEWSVLNSYRGELIAKNVAGKLTDAEWERLEKLSELADQYIEEVASRPTQILEELEKLAFPEEKKA